MKIAFVTHTFSPEFIGGRENHIRNLAKALSKTDDITIFTGSKVKKIVKEKMEGYTLYNIPMISLRLSKNPLQIYRIIPHMFFLLKKEKFDIIHAFEYGCFSTDMALLYSRFFNIPMLLTVYGYVITNPFLKFLKAAYDISIGKAVLNNAKDIICISEAQKRDILKHAKSSLIDNKIKIQSNSIEVKDFTDLPVNTDEIRKRYKLNNGPILLAAGRLLPRKGFNHLITAMKEITEVYPDINLIVLGPDMGELTNLENLANELSIKKNIFFTGPSGGDMIKKFLAVCDIFIHPSLYEGLPLVLLEAMACGKPIVATKLDGIQKALKHKEEVLFVNSGSHRELTENILLLLKDRELVLKIAENAKRKVKEHDIGKEAIKIKQVYKDILGTVKNSMVN
ncbi:glycosyltransferase family 4 protein [Elusimicrobiota bacterium]